MDPTAIIAERLATVAVGRTWIATPFEDGARVKGAGVDCGHLLLAVYEEAGVFPHIDPGKWARDWFMHESNEERYLELMIQLGKEQPAPPGRKPEPADALIWRYGAKFSHGAIVTDWPKVIHCFAGRMVLEEDLTKTPAFSEVAESQKLRRQLAGRPRPMRVFTPKRWA